MGLAGMGGFIAQLAKQELETHFAFTQRVAAMSIANPMIFLCVSAPLRFNCFF